MCSLVCSPLKAQHESERTREAALGTSACPQLIRSSVSTPVLHWVESSVQTTDTTTARSLIHTTQAQHAFLYCLQIPMRLNFAAEQYLIAVKTNTGPGGLIVRTRVLPVETWGLLEHSALVSGLALTAALLPGSERSSARLHAPQTLIMMLAARTVLQISDQPLRSSHCPSAGYGSVWLVGQKQH